MEMPEKIDNIMFAPCGINCKLCVKHTKESNSCPGCLIDSPNKTKNSLKCKIKSCLSKKRVKYCGRCSEFPCKLIKKQDKNYKKRYNFSTLNNAKRITYTGINKIMDEDKEKWACPECNGIVTIQDKICTDCKKRFEQI